MGSAHNRGIEYKPVWFFHAIALQGEVIRKIIGRHKESFLAAARCLYVNLPRRGKESPAVEVSSQWIPLEILKNMFDTISVRVVHAPYIDGDKSRIKVREYVDITRSSKDNIKALERYLREIASCKPRDIPLLVVYHPLPLNNALSRREIVDNIKNNVHPLLGLLQEYNIYIGFENMPWFSGYHKAYTIPLGTPEFFELLFEKVDSGYVGMTFDFGHANSVARYMYNNGDISLQQLKEFYLQTSFFSRLGEKIFHIHFNFNPAHRVLYRRPWITYLPKFRNYDTHEPIDRYNPEEIEQLKTIFNLLQFKRLRATSPLTYRTITLELIPRALNLIKSYEYNISLLRSWLGMLQ